MEFLPYEVVFNILVPLSYHDIINFCHTNQQYLNILQDINFW